MTFKFSLSCLTSRFFPPTCLSGLAVYRSDDTLFAQASPIEIFAKTSTAGRRVTRALRGETQNLPLSSTPRKDIRVASPWSVRSRRFRQESSRSRRAIPSSLSEIFRAIVSRREKLIYHQLVGTRSATIIALRIYFF